MSCQEELNHIEQQKYVITREVMATARVGDHMYKRSRTHCGSVNTSYTGMSRTWPNIHSTHNGKDRELQRRTERQT